MFKELRAGFRRVYSQEPELQGRVPARINLLGTHVEHQGGYVNTLAVDHYLYFAASYRNDSVICARNQDPAFQELSFHLEEMIPSSKVSWNEYIHLQNLEYGNWGNYIKAVCGYFAVLRGKDLRQGLNLYFSGDIPVGAGLSSSSSLVVAVTLLLAKAHGWSYSSEELVEIAGRAEWYVGTRGGWGDHAAMVFGEKERLAHFCFFPFHLEYSPFPSNLSVICAHSMVKAKKSEEARNIFNQRIACYQIGLKLVHQYFSHLKEKIPRLRDINPRNLGNEEQVYEILLRLPRSICLPSLFRELPGQEEALESILSTHAIDDYYPIRDVMSYGIAECERSRLGSVLMKAQKYHDFGELMFISHDGDRVSSWKEGKKTDWLWEATDENIAAHQKTFYNKTADTVSSLAMLPGAYRCSIPEIDCIVDIVKPMEGVLGAKLTGAGLGGAVLILVEKEQVKEVIASLTKKYYYPRNFSPSVFECRSVAGAVIEGV